MAIQGLGSSLSQYRNYKSSASGLGKSTQRLSGGYRINSAADDASGLAISQKMRAQISVDEARLQNTSMQISSAQTADGGLSTVQDSLSRMRDLAVQAANDTYSDADRALLQKEFSQLQQDISRTYESANFNGISLLSNAPGITGMDISTATSANQAMAGLENAINAVSSQRGDFGALQTGAEYTAQGLRDSIIHTQEAESEIRDLDVALAVMENTRKRILHQSSIAMLAQANQNASGVMRFLQ